VQAQHIVGAANAVYDLAGCLQAGFTAGLEAAKLTGFDGTAPEAPHTATEPLADPKPVWFTDGPEDRQFVDLQRDATVADVRRATGAGMRSVEHVKRYTTIGTAHDQGKTSGVLASGITAELLGVPVQATGTTTFRPPYTPVTFGAIAGLNREELFDPVRTTSIHSWHAEHGAVFEDVGSWKRPRYYPREGEDMHAATARECRAVREEVGIFDASTLGKIDLQGADAGTFLDRVYTNLFSSLEPGRGRYGLMCRDDGYVFDDGVTSRLAPDRFHMTTTTGGAARVLSWLEEWLQTEWPDLKVYCTSVTEEWAVIALAGPRSRDVLRAIGTDIDLAPDAFPHLSWRAGQVAGVPARVFRVSFSGELAYEVNVPAGYGRPVWEALVRAGQPFGITPYGTEAMHVLRAEKGYIIVGQDTDGTVTPLDLGMGWIVSKKKPDFIGKRGMARSDLQRPDRKQLVGLLTEDPAEVLEEGAQLTAGADADPPVSLGHVTSSYMSPGIGRSIALALVRAGRERMGQTLHVPLPGRSVPVRVVEPVFLDPKGERLHA
jgi:sarcosine oxidase subunit alpha